MKKSRLVFLTIFTLAAGLRLVQLGLAPLWYDEVFSATLARLPLGQMLQATAGDTHPPLYYLILWGWVRLAGYSEFALRMPSLIFSLVGLWLFWRLSAAYDLPDPVRLVGLGFMAFMPVMQHYAQEARMYALFVALVLWAALAVKQRRWVQAGIANTLILYIHNYGLFYVPVLFIMALWPEVHKAVTWYRLEDGTSRVDWQDCQSRECTRAFVIPGLAWLPWGVVLLSQMRTVAGGYWIQAVTPGGVLYAVYMLFLGFATPDNFQVIAILVCFAALILAVLQGLKSKRLAWLALGLLPLVVAVAGSLIWRPVLLFRGLLPSAPFLYLLIADLIGRAKLKRLTGYIFFTPVILAGLIGHFIYNPANKGGANETVNLIREVRQQIQPGDIIYHVNDGSALSWSWYAPDLEQYELPSGDLCGRSDPGSLSDKTRAAVGIQQAELTSLDYKRAWLIYSIGPLTTQCEEQIAADLRDKSSQYRLVWEDDLITTGVYLYEHVTNTTGQPSAR